LTGCVRPVESRNPCRIAGAGVEASPERPIPTGDEVWALADAMPPRWRALVLTSAFGGLRVGELLGLQRRDIDLEAATISVERQIVEVGSQQIEGPPKSDAGVRTVSLPMVLVPELRHHLAQFTADAPTARVFVGVKGATPKNTNLNVDWRKARTAVGRVDLHLHDMRHFANTLAASAGASTKELMARLGHSSSRAALLYQHATRERDRAIADAIDRMIERPRPRLAASE
jgi:integrase